LLGKNVSAWEGEDMAAQMQGLDGLIRALDRIEGLKRICYTTSHPNDMREGLIVAHPEVEKMMPFLHLTMQSDSDRTLKAMNRDQNAFNVASVRRTCDILLERKGKLSGQLIGKSPWLQSVHLVADAAIGDMVEVEIAAAWPNSVSGVERVRAAA